MIGEKKSNGPPYLVLELNKIEALWIFKLLEGSAALSRERFKEQASMSSSDPRARERASLMMGAAIDQEIAEHIRKRISNQAPEFEEMSVIDVLQDIK